MAILRKSEVGMGGHKSLKPQNFSEKTQKWLQNSVGAIFSEPPLLETGPLPSCDG